MLDYKRRIVAEFDAENKAKAAMAGFRRDMDSTGQAMKRMAAGALAAVGGLYALKHGVIDSVKEFASFEKQMAMVSTMLDDQAMHLMPQYTGQIRDMAKKFGEGTETMAKGLYDILSASIAPSKAMDVLTASIKAAKAGMTDTGVAADAITTILNSYGYEAEQAGQVSDKLFAIVKKGKTTFADLAPNIGKVAALAAQANLSFDELGAVIATLTRSGLQTELAMTGLRSIITQFLKPNKEAIELARQYGFELNTATLEAIGLTGVMRKLKGITGEQLAVLMPNVRGMAGFAIAVNSASEMTKDYEFIMNSANQTQEAFNKMADTTSFKLDRLNQRWIQLKITIGETVVNWWDAIAAAGARWEEQENVIKRAREEYRKFTGDIKAFTSLPLKAISGPPAIVLPEYPAIYQGIMNQIIGGYKAMEPPLEVQKEALKEIYGREKKREELIKAVETFEKQSTERLEQQRKIIQDIRDELQFERELMEGTTAGPLAEAAEKWQELLKNEQAYGRAFEAEMEGASAYWDEHIEDVRRAHEMTIFDIEAAYRSMYSQMGRMTEEAYQAQVKLLDELKQKYLKNAMDRIIVEQWYNEQIRNLQIEAGRDSDNFFEGVRAAYDEMEKNRLTLGRVGYRTAHVMQSAMTDAFYSMIAEGASWRDAMESFCADVGRAMQRLAAQMMAESIMFDVMRPLFGGFISGLFGGDAVAAGGPKIIPAGPIPGAMVIPGPSLQHGGAVEKTGWAVVHRGETFSGVGREPTKVEIHNESGIPMEVSGAAEYMISDRRIIEVTMRAAQTDMNYRRSHAQIR